MKFCGNAPKHGYPIDFMDKKSRVLPNGLIINLFGEDRKPLGFTVSVKTVNYRSMFVLTHNQTSHFRLYSKPYFSKPFKSRMYGEGYFGETMSDVIIVFDVSSETLQGYIKVYEKRLFGKPITGKINFTTFWKAK